MPHDPIRAADTRTWLAKADMDLKAILFYQTEDGRTRRQVRMEGETVWLSQRDMAELFQTSKQNVSLHIQNIFAEREVTSEATVKTVQNKMHWAIVGQTAAEIVHARASAAKPRMGLTSWSGDQPYKGDVSIAKNYLNKNESRR